MLCICDFRVYCTHRRQACRGYDVTYGMTSRQSGIIPLVQDYFRVNEARWLRCENGMAQTLDLYMCCVLT